MGRPTRELSDLQHHVLELAAEEYAQVRAPGERLRLAKQRAAQAERTEVSGNAYRFAVEAAALLLIAADAINKRHLDLGMQPLAPSFDR